MLFENPPVDIGNLPSRETIEYQPLEKKYLKVKLINQIVFFLVFLIVATVFKLINNDGEWELANTLIILGWVVVYVLALLYMRKAFRYKGFVVRQKDIIYKKGWLWNNTLTVPFNRIQHCEVSQGPIEKMFNLSKLNIYTAGGQNSDMKLPGLSSEEASKIKTYLLNQINESKLSVN